MSEKLFPLSDALIENPSRYCATLAISESLIETEKNIRIGQPDENSRNGTITFVKTEGRVFGITCWHVVEYLRDLNKKSKRDDSHSFYTMTPRPYIVVDSFIRPTSLTEYYELDIAIRQVSSRFVKGIGKEAIDLDTQIKPKKIDFGITAGFPEGLKYHKEGNLYDSMKKISLPTVTILAEIDKMPSEKFTLFSEFDKAHEYKTFSGMSGSPILWSTRKTNGIFGIAWEINSCIELNNGKSIMVKGELASPEIIKHWISQIPELWQEDSIIST